jgi:transposase-like protein
MSGERKLTPASRAELIRDIASGEMSLEAVARKYDIVPQYLHKIKRENAGRIAALKEDVQAALDEHWIAQKVGRVAEYQQDVEAINEVVYDTLDPKLLARKHTALHAVAEEMGQLPNRVTLSGEVRTVNHTVNGLDVGDVK